jgi:DNA excision repair protein ERCC-3
VRPMSAAKPLNPLIVQSDGTVLLDLHSPGAEEARQRISAFAELVKCPEHVHTYRIDSLSIWNARAAGLAPGAMVAALEEWGKYPLPAGYSRQIREIASRFGRVVLTREHGAYLIRMETAPLAEQISRENSVAEYLGERLDERSFSFSPANRGALKQALTRMGFPGEDLCGYEDGDALAISLRDNGKPQPAFAFRPYQREALDGFLLAGSKRGGSGVVVLPCGAGKTIVGLGAIAALGQETLILCTSNTAARQWRGELLTKTTVRPEQIAQYSAECKAVGPITITTYQLITWRAGRAEDFPHLAVFDAKRFGLIVYDEVHVVPAPVFRATARLQARRRLGLTATLVREDGRESDVFSLIGPKRYDVPWRVLEQQGFVAKAVCTEIRVPMHREREVGYALAPRRQQFRVAAENERKEALVRDLLELHPGSRALIMGEFISQVEALARHLEAPLLTGRTPKEEREELFDRFRQGTLPRLVLSKVGNFAVDLPDADLLIQVSGAYGSRQEEAQRLGRILRPKPDGRVARFYTLVSRHTCEEDFALKRQRFLTEQGYTYRLEVDEP